ncbi:Sugar lactone lactonase YvrE [Flavobacteriaceae bacterium MAR_2010_188]|nr:Sugar lactone lactonase YvrE [Flavobacteriaceae bacterium MAR_2010_188]
MKIILKKHKLRFYCILSICSFFILSSCKDSSKELEAEENTAQKTDSMTTKLMAELEYEIKSTKGEGAFWNHKSNELFWVDIDGKKVNIYNPQTKTNKSIPTPSMVGTLVPKSDIEVVVALEDGIYILNTENSQFTLLTNIEKEIPTNRFNDGKADPAGRLWVGSMAFNEQKHAARLYMVDQEGRVEEKIDSITISNGIAWSKDNSKMYYIDTPTAKVKVFDYNNSTGEISNEKVAVEVPNSLGYPDGMTIDEEGMLWVAMWNGNAVYRFDPNTGETLQKIEVPAHNVTSCAFGGNNLETLYITSATVDMKDEEHQKYPLAGSVFRVVPGVKGVKSSFFGNDKK